VTEPPALPSPGDPFDPVYLRALVEDSFGPLVRHWFRPLLLRKDRLPSGGPAVLAGNHSGTAFPWDAMVLDALLWRHDGMPERAKCRSVFERELSMRWWMRPFGIDDFWRRGGGVDMTFDNFDRLLADGHRVLYYPEGVPGIGKGFLRRYRLQRFSSSFVILAARHRAPVVPVHIVNAEWVIPFNLTLGPVDRLVERLFGVPFFPLPAAPLCLLFPWMWYLSLPARMIFVVGESIDVATWAREVGLDPERPDRELARQLAERVRGAMQAELTRLVERYGRRPYQARSLRRALARARQRRALRRVLPWSWPRIFVRQHRDRSRPAARHRLHAWWRDWDVLGWHLPFGWALLTLARRLRRPPCGYRGLTAGERRVREGTYPWNLAERPLPPPEK
jgi:1-acyl-sn-glycerol-3-phosphate acyltransferase